MRIGADTFVISDWHLGHKNVIAFSGRPNNHEELIIERCNEVVRKHNKLLVLGDLALTNKENVKQLLQNLQCQNRCLVWGNHDSHGPSWYRDIGFETTNAIYKSFTDKYNNRFHVLLTHEPVIGLPPGWINIHGHIHKGTHREYDLTENHFNVSCEVLDFRPIRIGEILKRYAISELPHD